MGLLFTILNQSAFFAGRVCAMNAGLSAAGTFANPEAIHRMGAIKTNFSLICELCPTIFVINNIMACKKKVPLFVAGLF
jgi:hypothetical protein